MRPWQRWTAAVGGAALGVAGGLAVFVTDNEVGATALLFLGGLALLMSLTGRVPDRIGKEGMSYEVVGPVEQAVKNVLADEAVPIATREVVAEAVRYEFDHRVTSKPAPGRQLELSTRVNAVLLESKVLRALEAVVPNGKVVDRGVPVAGLEVDAVVRDEGAADLTGAVFFDISPSFDERHVMRTIDLLLPGSPRTLVFVEGASGVASPALRDAVARRAAERFPGRDLRFLTVDESGASGELEREIAAVLA
ncbi:hypothetical protein BU204_26460 [Actinophytocola xanthii]|uniref:Uncharacterized protein n=1 Tax=Actinophytocola xanthii TaxID=1912961 RepID=A0A1Q8CGS2_9PSEU|nr:hypothetical protein BU204_26460 [Actinophytocola xanthii]